jgi:hypothetical protein
VRTRARFASSFVVVVSLVLWLAPGALSTGPPVISYASSQAGTAAAASAAKSPNHGVRRIPHSASAAAPLVAQVPHASGQAVTTASPSLLANFNGVSSRDSEVTNFGQEFEPPDQGLCAGGGFVVEMVNSAYTVYKPNGTVVTGPFNVNGPFDEGLTEFTSDPRCQYDQATNRFYALILFISADGTRSTIDLAVSSPGDPTALWTVYRIDTTDVGGSTGPKHPGCPCFGDQPLLGIDQYNVYISTNEFSILGPQFNGAQIYAIAKSDLTAPSFQPPSTPAHFVHFDNLSIGGAPAASVQPAITTGTPKAEFFMNSLDPNGTFDQRLGVWAMTNRQVVATGGKPTLSSVVIPSEAYGVPPSAEQRGSDSLIDSGDDRMQQVRYINGELWGALDTSVTIPNDTAPRAGAAWFDVHPSLTGNVIGGTQVRHQGYLSLAGNYVLYPAIQATPGGNAAMVVSVTGAKRFPSAAYSVLPSGGTAFGDITVAAAGTTNYDPSSTRWGDYSWAVLDPSGSSVWMATEYVPPKASQTTDGASDWGTRVMNLALH